MSWSRGLGVFLLILCLAVAAEAAERSVVIDDFEDGKQVPIGLRSRLTAQQVDKGQRGTMLGEYRTTSWGIVADTGLPDPLVDRVGSFEIDGGHLVVETGVNVAYGLVVQGVRPLSVFMFAAAAALLVAFALAALRAQDVEPDLYTGSPCLFCLQSYGKIPWHRAAEPELVSIRGRR